MTIWHMMDTMLRDRGPLYDRLASGTDLPRLAGRFLLIFVCAAGIYGAAMGSFRMLHPQFVFSDFELTDAESKSGRTDGEVAGIDVEAKKVYTHDKLPAMNGGQIRFNTSRPTEPYTVIGTGREKGYNVIVLAPGSVLQERGTWLMPILVGLKAPLLFVLTLLTCSLALYLMNLAFGFGLRFMPTVALITVALAATGCMLSVFVPIVALFSWVTHSYHFVKLMHVLVFCMAGLFGVRVLFEGLFRLTADPAEADDGPVRHALIAVRRRRVRCLLVAWLMLYALVGGQLAWTLKPFLGTPYLPATPPFRAEPGNIYVNAFQSLGQLGSD
jgi:hypothetical protein